MEYDNDGGYYGYIETTTDPGYLILVLTGLICVVSLLSVPCFVTFYRSYERRKRDRERGQCESGDDDSGGDDDTNGFDSAPQPTHKRPRRTPDSKECGDGEVQADQNERCMVCDDAAVDGDDVSVCLGGSADGSASERRSMSRESSRSLSSRSSASTADAPDPSVLDVGVRRRRRGARGGNVEKRRIRTARGITEEGRVSVLRRANDLSLGSFKPTSLVVGEFSTAAPSDEILALDEKAASEVSLRNQLPQPESCCTRVGWHLAAICRSFDFLVELSECDNEMKRILRLAAPFTTSEIVEAVLDNVQLALVSFYIGTDSMVAFALVDIVMGITSEFVGGFIESESSLLCYAIGTGNNLVAGQYFQLCCTLYTLFQIPFVILWSICMDDVMLLMGFDNNTARIAQEFARVAIFVDILSDISEAFYDFLEVIEREIYANILGNLEALIETGIVALAVVVFHANLTAVGFIMLVNAFIFMVINFLFTTWKGWIRPYIPGMIGSCAFHNRQALRQVFKTAIPLACGSVMAYGEWEILTIFAAFLGPAEAATWAILDSIWDTFEASTEGIGDAAEIRCAYHLGKGDTKMARISAYKSIYVATIFSLFLTSLFYMMGENLPTWFTNDPAIQHMLAELMPLVGMGNVTFTMGMVCWALIGGQGRYRLATCVILLASWLVILPLGAVVTYGLRLDLQGLTAAVVVGYAIASAILSIILFLSDWEQLSRKVREINDMMGEILSSDSEDSSSSSSSSSSISSSSSFDSFGSNGISLE